MSNIIKYNLQEEINKFLDDSSLTKGSVPTFVLIMGGVGAGKTTLRKNKFSKGYVVVDAGEIFTNLGGTNNHQFGEDFEEPMSMIGSILVSQAIKEKRNIVTEIIGTSAEEAGSMIDIIKSVGYEIHLQLVECDVAEAYKRHLNAVNTEPNYISSYFTESYHRKWTLEGIEKRDNAPSLDKELHIDIAQAKQIVSKYGGVITKANSISSGAIAAPESMLFVSKEKIKTAIKIFVKDLISLNTLDEKTGELLEFSFSYLGRFVKDEDADLVRQGFILMKELAKYENDKEHQQQLLHGKSGEIYKKMREIQDYANHQFWSYHEEFINFYKTIKNNNL